MSELQVYSRSTSIQCRGITKSCIIVTLNPRLSMKPLYLIFGCVFISLLASAQCDTCVPDPGCVSADGFPAICPVELPIATAGEYYQEVITFYLPAQIVDPESEVTADLLELTVNSVLGLPFGLAFSLDDDDGVYFPGDGQNSGCATICGTPVLPGVYDVNISVTALVTALGFELTQNENFVLSLVVEEGEGGTESFSISELAACGELVTTFEATIGGVAPQQTVYSWDFGNGQQLSGPGPHTITYGDGGTYQVSLNTVISNPVMTSLNLTSLAGGWGGDADEFFGLGDPDPFFELRDGDNVVIYTSSTIDDSETGSWSGLNIPLLNPPYTLSFIDEDLVTINDAVGSAGLTVQPGSVSFSSGSGTNGNVTIELEEVNNITSVSAVNVFPTPDASFVDNGGIFSCQSEGLTSYVWYRNNIPLSEPLTCEFTPTEGGIYQLEVTNEFGCTEISEPYLYCPAITPVYNPVSDVISVPAGFDSYEWFFNGLPLDGVSTNSIENPELGNYGVIVTTSYGCETTSTVITVTVGVSETAEAPDVIIYPQPASDILEIRGSADRTETVRLYDSVGREVLQADMKLGKCTMEVSALSAGIYFIRLASGPLQRVIVD